MFHDPGLDGLFLHVQLSTYLSLPPPLRDEEPVAATGECKKAERRSLVILFSPATASNEAEAPSPSMGTVPYELALWLVVPQPLPPP